MARKHGWHPIEHDKNWNEQYPWGHLPIPFRRRLGIWLLQPWLYPMLESINNDFDEPEAKDSSTRRSGFVQGVHSVLHDLLDRRGGLRSRRY